MILKDKIASTLVTIKSIIKGKPNLYLTYSGGKDSTVLLHLTLSALMGMKKPPKTTIIHCNTLVENPVINSYAQNALLDLDEFLLKSGLNSEIKIITPNVTFWESLIGKGYPMPNRFFRWCQRTLKIKPTERYVNSIAPGSIVFTGLRMDESKERKNSMNKRMGGNTKINNKSSMEYHAPIQDFTETDIWEFLITEEPLFGSYEKISQIYKGARGECPLIPETGNKTSSGCGQRFGCWVCSLVKEDKTLKNQIDTDIKLRLLFDFRNWLLQYSKQQENRYPFTRKGKPCKMGSMTFEARYHILNRLLQLQDEYGETLITGREIENIYEQWDIDKNMFPAFCMNLEKEVTYGV